MTTTEARAIGAPVDRREDKPLLEGSGMYVADVRLPDMLHLAVVRSEHAHADLGAVDVTDALAVAGVVDAFAAADIERFNKPFPTRLPVPPELGELVHRPLAGNRVRYVGEPIAVVVAESREIAEDAASLVIAELTPLQAVASVDAALTPDAPTLFAGQANVVATRNAVVGDVDAALAEADIVVTESFAVHRHTGSPLETRGLVASHDPQLGSLSIWGATKVPQHARSAIAGMLELPVESVHCLATDVGGGFGVRGELYPEDLLVPLASVRTGRPVRWIEDRREHLLSTNHSRELDCRLTIGLRSDGTVLALDAEARIDMGAYIRALFDVLALALGHSLIGPYRVPNFRFAGHSVLTNKMGVGSVRSPGSYEATFARERLLDICAARLGLDPIDLRRRNLIRSDELPYDLGIGRSVYDGGDFHATMDAVLSTVEPDYRRLRAEAAGTDRRIGLGIACAIEGSGQGQQESATVRYDPDGTFTVFTAAATMGHGHATVLAQVAADGLGVAPDQIEVVQADTRLVPPGEGTWGSRTMTMSGSAVWLACKQLVKRLETEGATERIEETATYHSAGASYPFAATAAVVELDPELYTVQVLRYVLAADVGVAVNPTLVHGQLAGAAVLGIGGALLEELSFDQDAQPLSTSFMDYLLPSSLDVPEIETILMDTGPAPGNPLGVRGAGEIGTPGAGAALANAVADALGESAGAITSLPLAPDRLLAAVARYRSIAGADA